MLSSAALLESSRRRRRGTGALILSVAVHAALIAMSLHSWTYEPPVARIVPIQEEHLVRMILEPGPPKAPDAKPGPASATLPAAAAIPGPPAEAITFSPAPTTVLTAPVRPTADAMLVSTGAVLPGVAGTGIGGGGGDPILDASQLGLTTSLLEGQIGPPYPESLRDVHPDGAVLARFVIDSTGRVEPASIRVVSSTDPEFTQSVRATLPDLRFRPARLDGRALRVRVEERFEFHCACAERGFP